MLHLLGTPRLIVALLAASIMSGFVQTAAGGPAPDPAHSGASEPASADTIPGHKFFPLPFVFYQPETRLGGGFGILHTYRTAPDTRTSSDGFIFVYTQRKQHSVAIEPELYTTRNRWRISGSLAWSRFPDSFYGIGNETRSDQDESFTLEYGRAVLDVRRAVAPGLYAGLLAAAQNTKARRIEPGGLLAKTDITGRSGGNLVCLGGIAVLDDRDGIFAPTRGRLIALSFRRYDEALGSDFQSNRAELDARQYIHAAAGHTVAVQALLGVSSGRRPFYDLATLGGANVLRGIYEGRFRDRNRALAQAEYRFPVWDRFGGSVFAAIGEVAHEVRDLRANAVHSSGGLGLRYLLMKSEGARLRIDAGWADGGMQIYFGFGEAF